MLRPIIFLFILASCSQFKTQPSLRKEPVEKLLSKIKVVGEGRGRLGFKQQSYVFSYDALLKEGDDWLLAIAIPLHGEEVMTLKDLKSFASSSPEIESLEARINHEVDPVFRGKLLPEIRSMIRFMLAGDLGLKRTCQSAEESKSECSIDGEKYIVSVFDKEVRIKKMTNSAVQLELVAQNLTASFFTKTHFAFESKKLTSGQSPIMNLELFWK